MTLEDVIAQIKLDEGLSLKPYKCPAGKLTIGYGLNLDAGITENEADILLRSRVYSLNNALATLIPNWKVLTMPRRGVFLNMAYNIGLSGLLSFRRMLAAIRSDDYTQAAKEILDSKFARQVPGRAYRLAEIMKNG